jgi:predicted O-linked N-acetylglucosamine transferase (SPINDLY family)
MTRTIPEIFVEAQTYFDAKEWALCRVRLEELFARNYRPDVTAMYLGDVCFADGDVTGSLKWHRQALELNDGLSQALEHMIFVKDAQPETTADDAMALRREWWTRFGQGAYAARRPLKPDLDPDRVLRVGYVSGDFKFHSASCAFATTITGHTHQIDPFFYSTLEPERYDALSHEWQKGYADSWRDASAWPLPQLSQQIRADRIDILVDLSGSQAIIAS